MDVSTDPLEEAACLLDYLRKICREPAEIYDFADCAVALHVIQEAVWVADESPPLSRVCQGLAPLLPQIATRACRKLIERAADAALVDDAQRLLRCLAVCVGTLGHARIASSYFGELHTVDINFVHIIETARVLSANCHVMSARTLGVTLQMWCSCDTPAFLQSAEWLELMVVQSSVVILCTSAALHSNAAETDFDSVSLPAPAAYFSRWFTERAIRPYASSMALQAARGASEDVEKCTIAAVWLFEACLCSFRFSSTAVSAALRFAAEAIMSAFLVPACTTLRSCVMSSCTCFPGVSVLDQLRLMNSGDEQAETDGSALLQTVWASLRTNQLICLKELLESHSSTAHLAVLSVLHTWTRLCHDRLFDCAEAVASTAVNVSSSADAITTGRASDASDGFAALAAASPKNLRLWDVIATCTAMLCGSSLAKVKLRALELWCLICGRMLQPEFVKSRGMSAADLALAIPLRCWDLLADRPTHVESSPVATRKLCLAFVLHVVKLMASARVAGCMALFENTLLKIAEADPVVCSSIAPFLLGLQATWCSLPHASEAGKLDVMIASLGLEVDSALPPNIKRRRERESAFVYEIDDSMSLSIVEQSTSRDTKPCAANIVESAPAIRENTLIWEASPALVMPKAAATD